MSLRTTLIVNPAARGARKFEPTKALKYLRARGCEVSLVIPESAAHATQEARLAAERGEDLLFVAGGDGSVRDAAMGLAGSGTALAALPAGTVNIWAKESGIPRGTRAAIDAHLGGQSVHIDLGRANGTCFLLMAGIGWDAEIAARVSTRLKRVAGDVAYMAQAAWMAVGLRTQETSWQAGEQAFEAPLAWMVIGNTRLYGGKIHLTPEAAVDDGELDLIAMCPRGLMETARLAGKLATGKRSDARIVRAKAGEIRIETPGLPVQLDGDFAGTTPMTFSADARALLVSVPAGPLAPIFGAPHQDRRKP